MAKSLRARDANSTAARALAPSRYNFKRSNRLFPTTVESSRIEVHRSTQSVRWGDMDALGHVNNTLYFRYMEQARLEWLYAFVGHGRPYESESGPLIVNASCTFFEPIVYPSHLEVVMSLGEPGRTSVGSFYDIHVNGHRVAEGAARMVWVARADGRPTPLPGAVRRLIPGESDA